MPELLLRGGQPWRYPGPADILVRDGVIDRIEAKLDCPDAEVVDVSGRLVLPGLIEAHCHLDKTLFGGPWVPHSAGEALAERIANERRRRSEFGIPNVDYITALLERMAAAAPRTFAPTQMSSRTPGSEESRQCAPRPGAWRGGSLLSR